MLGALILAFVILVFIPVSVLVSGGVMAGVLGWSLKSNGEAENEGSELLDLNV